MKEKASIIVRFLERYIPMTVNSLILFCFVLYLIIVVSRTVIINYKSNQEINKEGAKLAVLENDLKNMQYQINYYETYSFKEKEARAKLGYKLPGENILSLPIDTEEEKMADSGLAENKVRVPNYRLWWQYFF